MFEGLSIWNEEKYRQLQGTYPVIFLSFARVKEKDYENCRSKLCEIVRDVYREFSFLREGSFLDGREGEFFEQMMMEDGRRKDSDITSSIHHLSWLLHRYYGKKVIILLDEYDTPMQEAYVKGYWEETVAAALIQIEEKQYEKELIIRGIEKERIRKYGFAFLGKEVLIGEG